MVKIYARMIQEDEDDQLISFEADLDRLSFLHQLCLEHDLSEAVIKMPAYEHIPWPDTLPDDGYISEESREFIEADFYTPEQVDDFDHYLEVLHVGANRTVHIELRGGPSGEWWSEPLEIIS